MRRIHLGSCFKVFVLLRHAGSGGVHRRLSAFVVYRRGYIGYTADCLGCGAIGLGFRAFWIRLAFRVWVAKLGTVSS